MDRSASEQDIKKAYKRLSRKYHPDKNNDADAEGKFVEVAHGESASITEGRTNLINFSLLQHMRPCLTRLYVAHISPELVLIQSAEKANI